MKKIIALLIMAVLLAVLTVPAVEQIEKNRYPLKYTTEVEQWAAEYDMDPMLIYAVIRTESDFKPDALSSSEAMGLMQMTADTFNWLKIKAGEPELLVEDLFKPEISIKYGTYFLSLCIKRYDGDLSTALAAYHSGWGTIDNLLKNNEYSENGVVLKKFPYKQMNHYINKVNRCYRKYTKLYL